LGKIYGTVDEIEFYKTRVWLLCRSPVYHNWGIMLERVEITDEIQRGDQMCYPGGDYVLWTSNTYPGDCTDINIPMVKYPCRRPNWWKRFLLRRLKTPKKWMQ
jgi:hypothetical protein